MPRTFAPYRAVGYVADSVPFHLKRLGNREFLTVSVGKAWQVYDADKLKLSLIGPQRRQRIRAVASIRDLTFTAHGSHVVVWRRTEQLGNLQAHTAPITTLFVFGPLLLSLDSSNVMCIWHLKGSPAAAAASAARKKKQQEESAAATGDDDVLEEEEEDDDEEDEGFVETGTRRSKRRRVQATRGRGKKTEKKKKNGKKNPDDGEEDETSGWSNGIYYERLQFPLRSQITALVHPPTYLNKIVIGTADGQVELWNLRSRRRVFAFDTSRWSVFSGAHGAGRDTILLRNAAGVEREVSVSDILSRGEFSAASRILLKNLARSKHALGGDGDAGQEQEDELSGSGGSGSDSDSDQGDSDSDAKSSSSSSSASASMARRGVKRKARVALAEKDMPEWLQDAVARAGADIGSAVGAATGGRVGVSSMAISPAVDVIAVGLDDGTIVLHNLKFDETITRFSQSAGTREDESEDGDEDDRAHSGRKVTSLSFRSDGILPLLASSNEHGDIAVWNLKSRALSTIMRRAHTGAVCQLQWLQGQPVLISAGADNALRQWLFDQPDGTARLLRSRAGHYRAPTKVRFYGGEDNAGHTLLTSGLDRSLRYFSTVREQQSGEFSQGASLGKLAKKKGVAAELLRTSPIVDFVSNERKEHQGWANVVSVHEDDAAAYTWSFDRKAITGHKLVNNDETAGGDGKRASATACDISPCGNFAVVGCHSGRVDIFNVQSGSVRGSLDAQGGVGAKVRSLSTVEEIMSKINSGLGKKAVAKRAACRAHTARVTGVCVDGLNSRIVTAGLDGYLRFWAFSSRKLEFELFLGGAIGRIVCHRANDLLACVTDDLRVHVVDAVTRKVVRRFRAHPNQVTDACFSPDGRWLLTACMDCSVRVFDLPSGRLIDWFAFNRPATSLCFSPKGDYLATTHVDSVGIFLWVNRSYFSNVFAGGVPRKASAAVLPSTVSADLTRGGSGDGKMREDEAEEEEEEEEDEEGETDEEEDDDDDDDEEMKRFGGIGFVKTPKTLGGEGSRLLTLSGLPRSRWANLAVLDVIRQRNKPKEAPKTISDAPFFLPTLSGLTPQLALVDPAKQEDDPAAAGEKKNLRKKEKNTSKQESNGEGEEDFFGVKDSTLVKQSGGAVERGVLATLLLEAQASGWTDAKDKRVRSVLAYLKSLPPSALDSELRSLGLDLAVEEQELLLFLRFVNLALAARTDFEFLQAVLHLFLTIHSSTLTSYPDCLSRLAALARLQKRLWASLEADLQSSMCLAAHFAQTN